MFLKVSEPFLWCVVELSEIRANLDERDKVRSTGKISKCIKKGSIYMFIVDSTPVCLK